jgi:hypothetical protein
MIAGGRRHLLRLSHGETPERESDPGEGIWSIDRPYPLTPTLSPWERGCTELAAINPSHNRSLHPVLPERG